MRAILPPAKTPLPPCRAQPARALRARATGSRDWRGLLGAPTSGCLLALLLACVIGVAAARPVPPKPNAPAISLEYAVKATYLYKLAPFVNWPPGEFATNDAPFRICVVGDDPFDDFLEKAVAGRRLGAHPFEVRKLAALTPGADCQIAFIGHLQSQSVREALDAVDGKPVLTVTDSTAAPDAAGIVQFVLDHGRVAFAINTAAAARNHLTVSSKLLNLAVAVRNEG